MTETLAPSRVTVRLLLDEEYPRLLDLPFAGAQRLPDPALSLVLIAENEAGAIVGVWAALTTVHLDGLWVDPAYRKTSRVAVQLLRTMKETLGARGILHSFTYVESTEVLLLALKAGFTRLPGDLLFLDLSSKGAEACPSSPSSP
jgi:hypothetical protein